MVHRGSQRARAQLPVSVTRPNLFIPDILAPPPPEGGGIVRENDDGGENVITIEADGWITVVKRKRRKQKVAEKNINIHSELFFKDIAPAKQPISTKTDRDGNNKAAARRQQRWYQLTGDTYKTIPIGFPGLIPPQAAEEEEPEEPDFHGFEDIPGGLDLSDNEEGQRSDSSSSPPVSSDLEDSPEFVSATEGSGEDRQGEPEKNPVEATPGTSKSGLSRSVVLTPSAWEAHRYARRQPLPLTSSDELEYEDDPSDTQGATAHYRSPSPPVLTREEADVLRRITGPPTPRTRSSRPALFGLLPEPAPRKRGRGRGRDRQQ